MPSVALTLSLCMLTAVSRILLKHGLRLSNALTGMVVSLLIGWITLFAMTAVWVPHRTYDLRGILFFALIGVVAPPAVRYLTYLGVDRLGASRSDPVRSLTPFFAILFAFLFLGENIGPAILGGAVLIFCGVFAVSREGSPQADRSTSFAKKTDFLYPASAAVLAGAVANMRKFGSTLLESPILAATVAATSAMVVFGLFLLWDRRWKKLSVSPSALKFFVLAGLCTSVTDVLDLVALKQGRVSVVVPLLAASPLFIILLSHFFLKGIEKITALLIFGAVLIFSGVEVIILFAK